MPDAFSPWFPDRCDIQQDSSTPDNPAPDFSGTPFKGNVPVRFIPTSGDETFRGRQLEAGVVGVAEMRYVRGVVPTMRLKLLTGVYKDRLLNITYAVPVQQQNAPPLLMLKLGELPDQT
jgi:hypothetical protein